MVRLSRGVHSATAILASMTRGDWKVVLPPDHLVVNQDELFTVLYSIFFIVWCIYGIHIAGLIWNQDLWDFEYHPQ